MKAQNNDIGLMLNLQSWRAEHVFCPPPHSKSMPSREGTKLSCRDEKHKGAQEKLEKM